MQSRRNVANFIAMLAASDGSERRTGFQCERLSGETGGGDSKHRMRCIVAAAVAEANATAATATVTATEACHLSVNFD